MTRETNNLTIAVGASAKTKIWKNKNFTWTGLVARLSECVKTNETAKEFASATKEDRHTIKDVGGYVGGYLRNGRRNPTNVVYRQLLTLDLDFANMHFWDDFQLTFDCAAVVHSTHSHTANSPRLRLVMPVNREVTADEYVAISRKVAGMLDIELFDNTTFEPNRLMFWPSMPCDVEYYFKVQEGQWLDADAILATYADWRDTSLWPTSQAYIKESNNKAAKQEDPESKKGVVGAFCRTFSITAAIEKYLSEVYIPTDLADRYTYTKGSTAAGLIVYDDKFAFSHHGTDPCSGKLCNAFDLARLHLFGEMDMDNDGGKLTGVKAKSFAAMENLARKDPDVKMLIAKERLEDAKDDFNTGIGTGEGVELTEADIEWMKDLEVDAKGVYLSTAANLNLIFRNDPRLKNKFLYNEFDNKRYIAPGVPWRNVAEVECIKGVDLSGLRNYIEVIYGISSTNKIADALALEFEKGKFHPIREYLNGLDWDGETRLDNLLIDFLGARDCAYSREAIRKVLVGAVSRIFEPGCKFELVLTLIGVEGVGKSTIFKKLGRNWFSDSFHTMSGREAFEQLQGAWIIEMAELSGFKKSDTEAIKHFISKQEDTFRPAYGETVETYPRQCVFVATTNEVEFLKGTTGNRRFLPVDCDPTRITLDIWEEMDEYYIDQVWAEAMYRYREGEKLYLSHTGRMSAVEEQRKHTLYDHRAGLIENYLSKSLPSTWANLDIDDRRLYISGYNDQWDKLEKKPREFVCVAEIWCECLGRHREDMDRYKTRDINEILRGLDGWEATNQVRTFPIYGKQKYFRRKGEI